jgi:hypothetical protein
MRAYCWRFALWSWQSRSAACCAPTLRGLCPGAGLTRWTSRCLQYAPPPQLSDAILCVCACPNWTDQDSIASQSDASGWTGRLSSCTRRNGSIHATPWHTLCTLGSNPIWSLLAGQPGAYSAEAALFLPAIAGHGERLGPPWGTTGSASRPALKSVLTRPWGRWVPRPLPCRLSINLGIALRQGNRRR